MIETKIPNQILSVDEEMFGNTEIEKLILERLQQAANDPEIRKLMDVEDRLLAYEIGLSNKEQCNMSNRFTQP